MESSKTNLQDSSDLKEPAANLNDSSSQQPIEQLSESVQSKLAVQENDQKSQQIEEMSEDFVHLTRDPLLALQEKLLELQQAQQQLMNAINAENQKAANIPDMTPLIETMTKVPVYTQKVVNIRRGMAILSDRVGKLKRRTQKLQEKKMHDEMVAAERKERELERERKLTAQPSKSLLEREAKQKQNESWPTPTVSNEGNNTNTTTTTNTNNSNNNPPAANTKGQ